jgi:DNA-binding beta-propeller fold protein YncE
VAVLSRHAMPPRSRIASVVCAALVPACLGLGAVGCGGAGPTSVTVLPGPTGRLNPIYDVALSYPGTTLVIDGLNYQGLEIDLEIEFQDATLRDDDPSFLAEARVQSVRAGGVPQPFALLHPLDIEGTLAGGIVDTGFFGPIRVGTANLTPQLAGPLRDGGRHVIGAATLFGAADAGSFQATRRRRYLVAGTDLSSIGKVAVISVKNDAAISIENDLETISSDPVARVEDGRPFVVNRLTFDNLQGLDPAAAFRTTLQDSVGNGANPHDVVVLPPGDSGAAGGRAGLAFVTRYEPPFNDVAVLSLDDGTILESIDLVPYARNADHLPRADQALLLGGRLYVTLDDANRDFTQFMNGRVVVIDPIARSVDSVIDLSGQNPFESLIYSPETGLIYVGLAGIFPGRLPQALTGGIETIDPETRLARGLLVDDDDLGGNVSAIAVTSATRGYCVVTDASFHNFLKAFDPVTGEILGTVFDSADEIATIESDGDGFLLVAVDSFFDPNILILDGATGGLVASIPARLPPFSFAILTRSL